MDVFEEVSQDIKQAAREDKSVPAFQKAASDVAQWRHRDRSFIVRAIICLYVGAVAVVGIYLFLKGIFCQDINAASGLSDLIKAAVLPVVTLVIGYYFGSKSE